MLGAAIIGLLLTVTPATQAASAEPAEVDPLSIFSGDWQVVTPRTGEVSIPCAKAQRFAVAADRKTVVLTHKGTEDPSVRYMVLRSEKNRVLMFIEDENRTTEAGDPVLWWAWFDGPDRFRWRRYDWPAQNATAAEWRRCPAG